MDENGVLQLASCWLDEDGTVYQHSDRGSPPCKDFFHLALTKNEIILRVWKIVSPYRMNPEMVLPKIYQCPLQDFKKDVETRMYIEHYCRSDLLHVDRLLAGKIDYINRIDKKLLYRIIDYLGYCSVLKLGATNKYFREVCSDDQIWKKMYKKSTLQKYTTPGLLDIAEAGGWKAFYIIMYRVARHTDEFGNRMFHYRPYANWIDAQHIRDTSSVPLIADERSES